MSIVTNSELIVTDFEREMARDALVKGYHDCGSRWNRGPRACDCDDSRIDGCKARVEAIAKAIAAARKM